MDKGRAPAYQVALIVDRRNHVDIRLVNRRHVRIVEQKNVVGINSAISEALDDPLNGKTGARNVPAHGVARGQDITIGKIQRCRVVMHLRCVHGAERALAWLPSPWRSDTAGAKGSRK